MTKPAYNRRVSLTAVLAFLICAEAPAAFAQLPSLAQASLPHAPYWWELARDDGVEALPLVWTNDVDGGGSLGCCAVGAAGRFRSGPATVWFGVAFGTTPDAGAPAAIEAAAEISGGSIAFRNVHGRSGFAGQYPVWRSTNPLGNRDRVSVGISAVWLEDERYLESLPLFDCPSTSPSAPCTPVDTPYPWSTGSDQAAAAEAVWGRGDWRQPKLNADIVLGLEAFGGDHDYLRLEAGLHIVDSIAVNRLDLRLGGGWASGGSPLQRRFLLEGADPVRRWLNPYLDARGALFVDIPYFIPHGPRLRSYSETRPLVKRYVAASGELSRWWETRLGFSYGISAFLSAAWTPATPDRVGPEALHPGGALLFDWRELPDGEDEAQGRFRARSLEVSEIWADAGVAVSGSYDRVRVTLSFPVWASAPDFANEPIRGGEKKPLAIRWTLSIAFSPTS